MIRDIMAVLAETLKNAGDTRFRPVRVVVQEKDADRLAEEFSKMFRTETKISPPSRVMSIMGCDVVYLGARNKAFPFYIA